MKKSKHGGTDPSDPRVTSSQDCHASNTTSSFDSLVRLPAPHIVYRREDFTVGTLTYNFYNCKILVPQVRYMGVGNFSTISIECVQGYRSVEPGPSAEIESLQDRR